MTQEEYVNTRDHILNAVRIVDEPAALKFEKLCSNMERERDDNHGYYFMLKCLVGCFYDGLAYGNW